MTEKVEKTNFSIKDSSYEVSFMFDTLIYDAFFLNFKKQLRSYCDSVTRDNISVSMSVVVHNFWMSVFCKQKLVRSVLKNAAHQKYKCDEATKYTKHFFNL